jgi:hypothetical protein
VARGKKSCNLYVFQASISVNFVNKIKSVNACDLWHKRLSHISEKGLDFLRKKNLLSGLKDGKMDVCENCMAGKQTRVSFIRHDSSRKNDMLELVHSDVCGPLKVRSINGALYFVTFIDDHFRKLWV